MITNMQYLGIYEDAIDTAIESAENAFVECGINTIDQIHLLHENAMEYLKENGSFEEITNSIIYAYFDTAKWMINDQFPDRTVDYFVNCRDSHFIIDGHEV